MHGYIFEITYTHQTIIKKTADILYNSNKKPRLIASLVSNILKIIKERNARISALVIPFAELISIYRSDTSSQMFG